MTLGRMPVYVWAMLVVGGMIMFAFPAVIAATALLELERDHGGASARIGELERQAQATAIEATRRDEALAALARERELALESLPDSPLEAPSEEISVLDDEALEAELRRVRRTLAQIGSVNPFAVDEHRELSTRLAA